MVEVAFKKNPHQMGFMTTRCVQLLKCRSQKNQYHHTPQGQVCAGFVLVFSIVVSALPTTDTQGIHTPDNVAMTTYAIADKNTSSNHISEN